MLRRQLAAVGIGDQLAFRDAEQGVVRLVVLARREERLVGRHERQTARIGEIDQLGLRQPLAWHAVALQFYVEAVGEELLQCFAARQRDRDLSGDDCAIERSARAAGKRDQAVGAVSEPADFNVRLLLRLGLKIGARA